MNHRVLIALAVVSTPVLAEEKVLHLPLIVEGDFSQHICPYGGEEFGLILWVERVAGLPCQPFLDFPIDQLDSVPKYPEVPR